jgi:hypothetical protein
MLPGYNTDVQYRGSTYHIQTEDNGEGNPTIVTLVYQGGAILGRRKSDYRQLLAKPHFREEVRRLMQDQHREMIKLITEGKLETLQFPEEAPGPADSDIGQAAPARSLDEEITRFLSEMGE